MRLALGILNLGYSAPVPRGKVELSSSHLR